jgi:hypothetical protein
MTWQKPTFVEINLDAEIGSYQEDFGDDAAPLAERDGAADERDECV